MKFKIFKIASFASIFLASACTDLEEMNIDPYNPPYVPGESATDVNPEGIAMDYKLSESDLEALKKNESSLGSLFRNLTNEGPYNDYQVTTNLTHDIYAGYLANTSTGFHEKSPSYVYNDDWSKNRWNHFYDDRTASEYAQIIKICHFVNPEKYVNEFHVARIYYAFLTSMQTDTYGDIPLAYYVKGVLPPGQNVVYMPQEKVYDILFQLLDEAVTKIDPTKGLNLGGGTKGSDDRCFNGDINKWLRFANTLRLRLALRIANASPERAKKEAEAAITHPSGLMKSNADNMRTVPKCASVELGGEGGGGSENTHALIFAWGSSMVMSKDMEVAFKQQSDVLDPRCEVLFWRPANYDSMLAKGIDGTKDFAGCRIGNPDILGSTSTETYSAPRCNLTISGNHAILDPKYWFSEARELVWMNYAESCFLLAEAALRGWTAGSADAYFRQGVQASMDYYQIEGAKANTYLAGLKSLPNSNKEEALREIITQKWLATFPNGNEGWAEFRRTDYPELLNILENNSDGDVPEGKFIKRINYPQSESRNPNRPANLDNQGTRVWWDTADTNDDNGQRKAPNNFK